MKRRSVIAYSVPFCLLMFCWLTMGVSTVFDHLVITAYGFPLSWYRPSLISSGGYEIGAGRLIADLIFYAVLVTAALMAWMPRFVMARGAARILQASLWISAAASLFLSVAAFSLDPHVTWWSLNTDAPPNASTHYFVSAGLQPRKNLPE